MNLEQITAVVAIVSLVLFAGFMFYLMFWGKKEGLLVVRHPLDDPTNQNSLDHSPRWVQELADGTNDGQQPGKFWGLYGAPWQVPSSRTNNQANLGETQQQSNTGWSWGMYHIPYKQAWWSQNYEWYFEPKYWRANVPINTFNLAEKDCVDRYKTCVDGLGSSPNLSCVGPFESCMASAPHIDTSSIGH